MYDMLTYCALDRLLSKVLVRISIVFNVRCGDYMAVIISS